jgi:hypothetical protein
VSDPIRKPASRFGCLIPLGTALFLLVILPFGFFAFIFWAVEGSWDFEGRGGIRYWVFVKGSRLDRLNLIEPTGEPGKYSVSLQDGNFPGWRVLTYRSKASPEAIVEVYAKQCREMGFKITRGPEREAGGSETSGVSLVCEIVPYIDAEFWAERKPGETTTQVAIKVWGDD